MTIDGVAMGAALLLFLLSRQSPQAKAANRIRSQYLAVEEPMLRLPPDSSWEVVDHFLGKLKQIDTEDSHVRRVGGNTNAANDRVAGC